ncbi:MAG: hypothetical protein EA382_04085 [Spirochaetaceae bacterium]|nr:MAG: hypothetical protein EA382_04085 [Spirochaetaceae bacterium]
MTRTVLFCCLITLSATAFTAGRAQEALSPSQQTVSTEIHVSPQAGSSQRALRIESPREHASGRPLVRLDAAVYAVDGDRAGERVWVWSQREPGVLEAAWRRIRGLPETDGIPDQIVWDGTYRGSTERDGTPVPDGRYAFQFVATDGAGVAMVAPLVPVVVDRVPPHVGPLEVDLPVVVPGDPDAPLRVRQTGDRGQLWTATVIGDGTVWLRREWVGPHPPPEFVWDAVVLAPGEAGPGRAIPDGIYRYELHGEDRAGNRTSGSVAFRVAARGLSVEISADGPALSPHAVGPTRVVTLSASVGEPELALSYDLTAIGRRDPDRAFIVARGTGAPPREIRFDGRAVSGQLLNDDAYSLVLSVRYQEGHRIESRPVVVSVDSEPPFGSLAAVTAPLASPPGGSIVFGGSDRPTVRFSVVVSEPAQWSANVLVQPVDSDAYSVTIPLPQLATDLTEAEYEWSVDGVLNGRTIGGGGAAPDGVYTIHLEGIDHAGNRGSTNRVRVVRDTRVGAVSFDADAPGFAPVVDSLRESIALRATATPADLVESSTLTIRAGAHVVLESTVSGLHDRFVWDGHADGPVTVVDGEYSATLSVRFGNGALVTSDALRVTVSRRRPEVYELSVPYRVLRSDGDGYRDTVAISQRASADEWVARITGPDGRLVLERSWATLPPVFVWDARDASGALVADGEYLYTLSARTPAGAVGSASLALTVDAASLPPHRRPPDVALTVDPLVFTPDGDDVDGIAEFSIGAVSVSTVESWRLDIYGPDLVPIRSWTGSGDPPSRVAWDGRSDDGTLVPSLIRYRARLSVVDRFGNRSVAETSGEVGAMLLRDGDLPRIMVPDVRFAAGSASLEDSGVDAFRANRAVLATVAALLTRYPERSVLIRGHATRDIEGGAEQIELSRRRAESVGSALRLLGVPERRMRMVGEGGVHPVVPHEDRENAWKNRRVDFILE